jgi:hypothetical protein
MSPWLNAVKIRSPDTVVVIEAEMEDPSVAELVAETSSGFAVLRIPEYS